MPRKYIKKTNRTEIDEARMKQAIRGVLCGGISKYKAAQDYGIKRTTINSRLKKLLKNKSLEEVKRQLEDSGNESDEECTFVNKYTSQQIFTMQQEEKLATYIKQSSNLNYGLNYTQIRKLAFDYAKALPNCKLPGTWEIKKSAGNGFSIILDN